MRSAENPTPTLAHKLTVSHFSVILSVHICQLAPKSNSHISLPLLQLYKYQCIFQCYSIQLCTAMYPDLYMYVKGVESYFDFQPL